MKRSLIVLLFIVCMIRLFADQKGDDIARKSFSLKKSNDDYGVAVMVIVDKRGNKKIRKMEMFSKEGKDGRNSFVVFIEPADVKGTKFLTIGHRKGDDEQRLYLPALGKVRRISSSKKGGNFMGSDLNYFDMEDHQFEDFTHKYIKEEMFNGMECYVIESYPLDKNAPYSKQVLWISKDNNFTYKIDCYDKKEVPNLVKTIVIAEAKSVDGVIMASKMVVENHLTGGKTLFQIDDMKINIGLKDSIFTIQNLEK